MENLGHAVSATVFKTVALMVRRPWVFHPISAGPCQIPALMGRSLNLEIPLVGAQSGIKYIKKWYKNGAEGSASYLELTRSRTVARIGCIRCLKFAFQMDPSQSSKR